MPGLMLQTLVFYAPLLLYFMVLCALLYSQLAPRKHKQRARVPLEFKIVSSTDNPQHKNQMEPTPSTSNAIADEITEEPGECKKFH
jgi:hypothetical protein